MAYSDWPYPTLCYRDKSNDRTVTLLGSQHFRTYAPSPNGLVERLVDKSNQVFFENADYYPKDGVFSAEFQSPKELDPLVRLDSFVNANDIPEISRIFGIKMSGDTQLYISIVPVMANIIYAGKLRFDQDSEQPSEIPKNPLIGAYSLESAAYVYALRQKKKVTNLETPYEMFGGPEFEKIKDEISYAISCSKNEDCLRKRKGNERLLSNYQPEPSKYSYDELYRLSANNHDIAMFSLPHRNERWSAKLISLSAKGARSLVIVGATHIGGPVGLASKLESAKFVKVKCEP